MDNRYASIRRFREADLSPLRDFIAAVVDASYSGVYPPRAVDFFKDWHSDKRILERNAQGVILIVEDNRNGSILATGSLIGSEISGVFVRSDIQRNGIGAEIMRTLEEIAFEKGLSEIKLSVSLPSGGFYERLGYEISGELSTDVGEGQSLIYREGIKSLRKQAKRPPFCLRRPKRNF